MKVLVTGATTPVGSEVVRHLIATPQIEQVIACGVEDDPPLEFEPFLEPYVGPGPRPGLSYYPLDLTRPRESHDFLWGQARDQSIDVVIHMATHRGEGRGDEDIHALNVEATRRVLLMAERHPTIRRFLYYSSADVYAIRHTVPSLIDEDQPLEFDPAAPKSVRDRVEADLTVCSRMGMSHLKITVLRCAEVLAANAGSQLWDYLQSRVCFRPLGFDPMINLLSLEDAAGAVVRATITRGRGVYNIPGADTLPLSRVIRRFGRRDMPLPGPLLPQLYRLQTHLASLELRYDLYARRFHFGGVLDGARARADLDYVPRHPLVWPTDRGYTSRTDGDLSPSSSP